MKLYPSLLGFVLLVWLSAANSVNKFQADAVYDVCFTPYQNCTQFVVNAINNAQHEILIQAYSFTSAPIARALVAAHKHGVDVKIIIDRSQFRPDRYSSIKFLIQQNIPTWIDFAPNIAHNKIMIIDSRLVITGSFNFTHAAQKENTENLIIIQDRKVASLFKNNWYKRLADSRPAVPNIYPQETDNWVNRLYQFMRKFKLDNYHLY